MRIVLQLLKIATIAVTAVLIVAGGARAFEYYLDRSQPNDIGRRFSFTVSEEDTVDDVAKRLHEKGLIDFEIVFTTNLRVRNTDLVPAKYTLRKGMSVDQITDVLTGNADPEEEAARNEESEGDEESEESDEAKDEEEAETFKLTVREGWRTEQIAEELVRLGWEGSTDDFMKAVEEFPVDSFAFLESRENPVKPDSLEGFLFPATYEIKTDEPAQDIVQKMLLAFDEQFTPAMRERAAEMNLSIYQVLIFASLVEREAAVAYERPIIADVFLKRYDEGWRIESDPSVRYGIGKEDGGDWWDAPTAEQLQDESNPYNTYKIDGLPPGPICNPGVDSIKAVLTPAETSYYYFIARRDDSGTHLFAADEASQNQNINFVNGNAAAPAPGSIPTEGEIPIESTGG